MIIKLVRHGESQANIAQSEEISLADHLVPLTKKGFEQAKQVGVKLGSLFVKKSLIYTSPLLRTKQTVTGILEGAGVNQEEVKVREDPRIREVEHGYFNVPEQKAMINTYGHFYYRYQGGESAADCYDRVSGFLESFVRSLQKTKSQQAIIVTHGLALRVFVMRFLHLTVEQFDQIGNPNNADIVTITDWQSLKAPMFTSGRWGVEGIRKYS